MCIKLNWNFININKSIIFYKGALRVAIYFWLLNLVVFSLLYSQQAKVGGERIKQDYLSSFEELRMLQARGDKREKDFSQWDESSHKYFNTKYLLLVDQVSSSNLSEIEKKYISNIVLREAASLLTILDVQKINGDRFCNEFIPIYKNWESFFASIEKKKISKLEKIFASELHRLHGDMLVSYSPCLSGFSKIRILMKSVDYFDKALGLDNNNVNAHFAKGTYRYYAPRIGGGDLNKAMTRFEEVVKKGNATDRYIAHIFMAHTYMKKKQQPLALQQLSFAKAIYAKGPYLSYAHSLIDNGKFME